MRKIYSFDVFDTCLTRLVYHPKDVFRVMSNDIANLANLVHCDRWQEELVWARVRGEKIARDAHPANEPTIFEIWENVILILKLSLGGYAEIEMDWEEKLLIPVPEMKLKIDELRNNGNKIIFLSDMYLPSFFIEKQLRRHGIFKNTDKLYVSCEHGASKGNGVLYSKVSQLEGAGIYIHHGDNYHADVVQSKKNGWSAIHFEKLNDKGIEDILRKEKTANVNCSSLIAGVIKSTKLLAPSSSNLLNLEFVFPVLYLFVRWVLESAKNDKVDGLYFLGRDCQLAQVLARSNLFSKYQVDCNYLPASRRAFYLAGVNEVSPAELPWLQVMWENRRWSPITLFGLSKTLDIDLFELQAAWYEETKNRAIPQVFDELENWTLFWDVIKSEKIKQKILSNSSKARNILEKYLNENGIKNYKKPAFVDLGWTFGIQKAAEKCLNNSQKNSFLHGYYLASSETRDHQVKAKSLFTPLCDGDIGGEPSCSFYDKSALVEHILGQASHGSLINLQIRNDSIDAIFDNNVGICLKTAFEDNVTLLHEIIHRYAVLDSVIFKEKDYRFLISSIFDNILTNPKKPHAATIAKLTGGSDSHGSDEVKLVSPYTIAEVLKLFFLKSIKMKTKQRRLWKQGSFVLSSRASRSLIFRLNLHEMLN